VTQIVIIGGGHNGLTAAFYLAKAGFKPVVLEARDAVGGGAITGEHRGFKVPTLAHHASLSAEVMRDMDLPRHGLRMLRPAIDVYAPALDGGAPVAIYADAARTEAAIRHVHPKDAEAYATYAQTIQDVAGVLAGLLASPAPDINDTEGRDLLGLLKAGRAFRRLGRKNAYRLLRWGPMPVADLLREWFESDLLCAALAGPAVSGTMLAPRSAGSGLVLLLREATNLMAGPQWRAAGGPGALIQAIAAAARAAGAEIRTGTRVEQILVSGDRVSGVVANGQRIEATAVLSAADPKTTFLRLMDPMDLTPDFLTKIRNYRASGTVAKVNLALSGLPAFEGPAEAGHYVPGDGGGISQDAGAGAELLSGRIHIGPSMDYLERAFDCAKYGEMSAEPWLDISIPSILDPDLAPPGAHVMSIYAHYAPYALRGTEWATSKNLLLTRVVETLERFAPGVRGLIVAAEVISPADLESTYGFHGGHIYHGELTLDQVLSMRPLLGYSRYRGPVPGLFLCSGGTHPGGFMSGGSGRMAAREVVRSLG
jgi:phytoene dehydrogenase-like protein